MTNLTTQPTNVTQRSSQTVSTPSGRSNVLKSTDNASVNSKPGWQTRQAEVKSGHTQVLAEAMDGDSSEAIARSSLGLAKRDGRVDDDSNLSPTEVEREKQKSQTQIVQGDEQNRDEKGARQVSQKPIGAYTTQVAAKTKTEAIVRSAQISQSIGNQHDELMMMSSTMNQRDLATYVARKHAARLATIFSGEAWQIKRAAPSLLTAAQMPL